MSDNPYVPARSQWREGDQTYTAEYSGIPGTDDVSAYKLTVTGPGSSIGTVYEGAEARGKIKKPDGSGLYFDDNPYITPFAGTKDYKKDLAYTLASDARKALTNPDNPTFFGRLFNTPITATTGGAGIGALLGVLGAIGAKNLGLIDEDSDPMWYGLGGAAIGGGAGYFSNKYSPFKNESLPGLFKQSSMWQDPRNFLLEKLQRAQDINAVDKALLAGKIRSMSSYEATNLEKLVRGALGIGVGAIIAKFFGLGSLGTALSAMAGMFVMNQGNVGSSFFN